MSQVWVYVAAIALITTLVVQNWQPVLPLRFLGQQTPPLPLAFWIAAAAMVGLLWGQGLLVLSSSTLPEKRRPQRQSPEPIPVEDASMRAPAEDSEVADAEDWFEEIDSTTPREPTLNDSPPRRSAPYSHRYRPSRKSQPAPPPPQSVVDAEYRILTPPPPRSDDNEDWDIDL
ncbi:hypothetical protein L5470_06575 [Synechococcus sp. PCC 6717]|jgi:uncharacterized integral membrane protein|nr:hypothetical protein [Synechococcus sp. PCC 6717]